MEASTTGDADVQAQRHLLLVAIATVGFVLLCGVYVAWVRGAWLDEFWSLRMGDPAVALNDLIVQRWLRDTNPVWSNLLYRLARLSGVETITHLRLVLNVPAFALFAAMSIATSRRSPSRNPFYLVFGVLVVALPAFSTTLADFRAYFWQMCWTGILLQYAHWIVVEPHDAATPRTVAILGPASVFAAIALHFVSGLIVSVLLAILLLLLVRRKAWAGAARVGVPAALVGASMLLFAILQYRRVSGELDYSWIDTTTSMALIFGGSVLLSSLLANPVATVSALLSRGTGFAFTPGQRAFLLLLGATILTSAGLLLLANSYRPLVVDRYLLPWQPIVCAMLATAAARVIVAERWRLYAMLAFALFSTGSTAARQAREIGWNGTRDYIAAAVRRCPSAKVHAISSWRLKDARDTRAAALEEPVFAAAYRQLAREGGFGVSIVPSGTRILNIPPDCPLLLWVEHSGGRRAHDVRSIMADARLGFAQRARTSLFTTADGFVVVAQRAPAVG